MYKMVVEITKETWEKCGIKTLIYHNKEEKINESWQKMSNVEIQFGHSDIGDVVLKRIRKHWDKKTKDITEEKKQIYKAFFKGEEGVFNIEKLTGDVIKRCKLPKPIDLREETSIAEKIKKIFPNENIFLNKKVIKPENQIFGLKIIILPLKLMQEIMEIMR